MVESNKAFGGLLIFVASIFMFYYAYMVTGYGYTVPPSLTLARSYLYVIKWVQLPVLCFTLFAGILLFRDRWAKVAVIFGFVLLGLAIVNVIVLRASAAVYGYYVYYGGENFFFTLSMAIHLCLFPSLVVVGGLIGLGVEPE